MPTQLRLVNGATISPRLVRRARGQGHAAISTTFKGNGSGALAVTNSDRTLGSAAYRLRPSADERKRHGARPTDNNAQFCASDWRSQSFGRTEILSV